MKQLFWFTAPSPFPHYYWIRQQAITSINVVNGVLGPDSISRWHLTSIGNSIVEIRRSDDRLISTMGFPILVRWHLYIESGPWGRQLHVLFSQSFWLEGIVIPLQWHHNERNGISNHQPHDFLLNCLLRHRSKKTSKLCVTGLCEVNWPVTGEFLLQRASNVENVSNWWHHHAASYGWTYMHASRAFSRLMACLWHHWVDFLKIKVS